MKWLRTNKAVSIGGGGKGRNADNVQKVSLSGSRSLQTQEKETLGDKHQGKTSIVKKSANRKIHGLLTLKQSGMDQQSLIQLYKSKVVPTICHASNLLDFLKSD